MQSMSPQLALRRLVLSLLPQGARRGHFTCCSLGDSAGHALQQAEEEAVPNNQSTAAEWTTNNQHHGVGQTDDISTSECRPASRGTHFSSTLNQSDSSTPTTSTLSGASAVQLGLSARLSNAVRTVRTFSTEAADKYVVGNGSMTMKGVLLPGPNEKMYVEQFQIPKPQIGEVLIKTKGKEHSVS